MKGMGKKNIKMILRDLKEAHMSATYKHANFPQKLKEETKRYRESWILRPLKDVIDFLELVAAEKYNGEYRDWYGDKNWKEEDKE